MNTVSRGFTGRRRGEVKLPPGQYLEHGFPVLQTGPTPPVRTETWTFTITTETGDTHRWDWKQFSALPSEDITVDIHCVTQWSKLGTRWRGVSLDTLRAAWRGRLRQLGRGRSPRGRCSCWRAARASSR